MIHICSIRKSYQDIHIWETHIFSLGGDLLALRAEDALFLALALCARASLRARLCVRGGAAARAGVTVAARARPDRGGRGGGRRELDLLQEDGLREQIGVLRGDVSRGFHLAQREVVPQSLALQCLKKKEIRIKREREK